MKTIQKSEEYALYYEQFLALREAGKLKEGSTYHILDLPDTQDLIDGLYIVKKAEQDSEGNIITDTYRKIDDSYSKLDIDTLLSSIGINEDVIKDIEVIHEGDNVQLNNTYINLDTKEETTKLKSFQLASDKNAGLMSTSDYNTLKGLESRVGNLEGKTTRLLYTLNTEPTAEDINNFVIELGYIQPYEGISVVIDESYHIWHYYENESIWKDDGQDTVSNFTNTTAGIILGSESDGKIYAESDGTGSVYGWNDLKTKVTNLESVNNTINENKLTKVTEANIVYGTDDTGTQLPITYSDESVANTIAKRDSEGNIKVALIPKADDDAVSKSYLDANGGKIQSITINDSLQPIEDKNVNIDIPVTDVTLKGESLIIDRTAVLPIDIVQDSNYVHTDANYTIEEKNTLSELKSLKDNNEFGKVDDVQVNGQSIVEDKIAKVSIGDLLFSEEEQTVEASDFTKDITLHKIAKTGKYNDLSDKPEIVDNLNSESSTSILSARQGNELKKLIQAIPKASAYTNIEELINALTWANRGDFNVGHKLYIKDTNVPDYWVYSEENTNLGYIYTDDETFINEVNENGTIQLGCYKIAVSEADKIDLEAYATRTWVTEITDNITEALETHIEEAKQTAGIVTFRRWTI